MVNCPKRRSPFKLSSLLACAVAVMMLAPGVGTVLALEVQGHRGARGLAPENTLPAFEEAIRLGVDVLELDIGLTADGQVIVSHDWRLDPDKLRLANGRRLEEPTATLWSVPYAALRLLDAGQYWPDSQPAQQFPNVRAVPGTPMPLLSELFDLAKRLGPPRLRFNIETKVSPIEPLETASPAEMVAALLREIDAAGLRDRVTIQSFDWRALAAARALAPDIPRVHLTYQSSHWDTVEEGRSGSSPWLGGLNADNYRSVPAMVAAVGGAVWSPFFENLTPESLADARQLGLSVVVWTVNDPVDMQAMIEMGVDGIITDYPDRLLGLLGRGPVTRP